MNQTRLESAIEVAMNIAIGFTINWFANIAVLPLFGFHVSPAQAFHIGLIFTIISVARSYAIRRWFNAGLHKAAAKLATEMMVWNWASRLLKKGDSHGK